MAAHDEFALKQSNPTFIGLLAWVRWGPRSLNVLTWYDVGARGGLPRGACGARRPCIYMHMHVYARGWTSVARGSNSSAAGLVCRLRSAGGAAGQDVLSAIFNRRRIRNTETFFI